MVDIESIKKEWDIDKPLYEKLGKSLKEHFSQQLSKYEILPEISCRTKDLLSLIKKIQRKRIKKDYNYSDVSDKLGLRIICSFVTDLETVDKWIKEQFIIVSVEYKEDDLDFNELNYTSNHYDLKVKEEKFHIDYFHSIKDLVFEVQVRTINQHAWSSTAHILTYKKDIEIPKGFKRRVYRLLSLYEIADDEFSSVNELLFDEKNSLVYKFIKQLEGKVFRFCRVDFDRALSIDNFNKLLSKFDDNKKVSLLETVDKFIKSKEEKLERVFIENTERFYKIPIITQPEIFLIFYMMEKHENVLEEIYSNEMDWSELEILKGIWV